MANHGSAVVSPARADEAQPGKLGLGEVFGAARKNGADTQVARPGQDRGIELHWVMSRNADRGGGAHDAPGVANRKVLLARRARRRSSPAGPDPRGR